MKRITLLVALVLIGCMETPPTQPKPVKPPPDAEQVGEGAGGRTKGFIDGFKKGWKERGETK